MHATLLGLLLSCPNLAGKYATCRPLTGNGAGATDLEVSQSIKNGVMVYTFASTDADTNERESEIYRADGKTTTQTETDPDTGLKISLATTVFCTEKELKAKMVLSYGPEIYTTLITTLSKEGNTLTQAVKGQSMGEDVNETVICE